jgi:predicted branched-subunit amino acid permease
MTATPDRRASVLLGFREALGVPGMVMGASFLGFGSMVHESGLGIWLGIASTFSGWALPGQIALVELYGTGASLAVITVAVLLTNTRLLPLTVTLLPHLNLGSQPRWRVYALAHLIAVTSWAAAMRRCPELPATARLAYFVGFALTLWVLSMLCTAAGYVLAGTVPAPVSLALVFLNPVYFMLLLIGETHRYRLIAVAVGALLGPAIHLVAPDFSLLGGGLGAGTAAFLLERRARGG